MKLSDNEIRDIIELLKSGKNLPDKYRFILFGDDREIELVWNGKSKKITDVILPFQTIEHIDEPRSEKVMFRQPDLFDSTSGRQLQGWTNKLIWGDNKFILSSLKNGPLRDEIEKNGGIKLIYIDPPFDLGMDFKMEIDIGDQIFQKQSNLLEEIAYRDTWGKGQDSFISMLYERLFIMKDLLATDGSIYVHCDYRVSAYIRLILEEVFGKDNFRNQIIWKRTSAHNDPKRYGIIDDHIYFFSKSSTNWIWTDPRTAYEDWYVDRYYRYQDQKTGRKFLSRDITAPSHGGESGNYEWKGKFPPKGRHWAYTKENMIKMEEEDRLFYTTNGIPRLKQYLDEMEGTPPQTIWDDILPIVSWSDQKTGYPTQKPETLLERIIKASSNPNDIVCDFFAGSGTTAAVAEKLGRKWICSDLGKFAIHTSRKRMISIQRDLKSDGKDFRAFEILNLGKYEREFFINNIPDENSPSNEALRKNKENKFNKLILSAYQAYPVEGFRTLRASKNNRLIAVGPANLPLSRLYAEEVLNECLEKRITKVDILAFEFEMGLFPSIQDKASQKGIDMVLKHIPKEVFDPRAVKSGNATFHDVAYVEVKPILKKNFIAIELTNYSVFYTQGISSVIEGNLKNGSSQIIVENGKVLRISKDKKGELRPREVLTKRWEDWIDYWSVDFDFESKKEIIDVYDDKSGEFQSRWTGSYIFENEWQSFRTQSNRTLEMVSDFYEISNRGRKIAVKVVDIFGNDTMKIVNIDNLEKS